jgi:hypothetical protein
MVAPQQSAGLGAMAKKLRKSEKLDLILEEIAKLKGVIGKLVAERTAQPKKAARKPARTVAKKRPVKAKAGPAPKRPVLVAPSAPAPAVGRPGT